MSGSIFAEITDPWLELGSGNRVFTTLEGENAGGSIKDHMVLGELRALLEKGSLKRGAVVAEISAGSTAASLAHHCPALGLKCVIFVPITVPAELVASLRAKGADVHLVEMATAYAEYDAYIARQPGVLRFDQLFDAAKRRHYEAFGAEIRERLGRVDILIGAVGTGHSLLGAADGMGRGTLVLSVEPEPGVKAPGVRNVEHERYGDRDTCRHQEFDRRVIVPMANAFPRDVLGTDLGAVAVAPSFRLVLGGLKQTLRQQKNLTVFAVGASLKRVAAATRKSAAA